MRISTSQIHNAGLDSIQRQQVEMSRAQTQLASGKRILSPADDPGGAVQSLQFREAIARLDQFARNGGMAEARLNHEEVVLAQVMDGMQRVRELAIQGNNATQTPETRRAIAGEVRQQLEALYELANTRDANGEYLFAGFDSLDRPFSMGAGGVSYSGSDQAREIAISEERRVRLGDAGDAVFMNIPEGNGRFVVTEAAANTGSGVVQETTVRTEGAWDGGTRTLRFTAPGTWEAVDADGSVAATGTHAPGETLVVDGLAIRLDGTPAAGDTFELRPAGGRDMFGIYADLATALESGATTPAERAQLNGAIGRTLADLDQAGEQVSSIRSTVGSRLNAIDGQAEMRGIETLALQETLSEIEDLDYAEAISRFNLRMVGLQAAQQSYSMLARFSLFDYMR
ncbi:flagellar hook-associated protein FlgL [Thioalkalivibrio sp. XN279]|uniref:flagellar hook-associated protein FlgL n=1 Tax=Thioalkalivibrio sp. XN279 TaxID=2714953 RepID=UPI0014085430|nr:flagellar hook-associated protein FlgL [Thioalkalivibrio sp. XN279]NHA13377.1 flagellar hook-associated protein 3 [Thioalkalivibrio sp. XN279]